MNQPDAPRKFYYGWIIVGVCLFGISTGPAAFGLASMGLFSESLHQTFGWSRTEISAAVSIMMLSTALAMPLAGRMVDRWGARRVLIPSIVLLALCLLAMPMVTQYWQFIAVYLGMGTIAVGTNSVPYMRIIASWFDRRRGLAIGIAGSGTGLGFAYVPLLTEALVSRGGWQTGYIGLAAVLLLVTLPLTIFVLRESPRDIGLSIDGGAATEEQVEDHTGLSPREALRSRNFWVLASIFVGLAFVLYGLIPHLVPMLTDNGLSSGTAALIASVFGLAAFGGRLLIGFLIDKYDARRIALLFFSLSAVGLVILATPAPPGVLVLVAVLLGGSLGAEVDMLAYLASRYFGLRCFAQIFSLLFSAVLVAMGLGPLAFGLVYDITGSYGAILALGVPICIAAILLVLLLQPYGERARGGQISRT
ncbi:MFS transporter [Croceicoccus estronivorus]|uniref:MFS transporter n=1 Tax=Croceicoccus estronivorus TaxID=1172626 RepID=UPI0008359D82|nr:MFS transporter [Croceicoccus estronivorus]OCC25542.1 MFS transporter [Croceicoccus estronivorus]